MGRKIKIISSMFMIAMGGGLVYASVGNISIAGADSIYSNTTGATIIIASLIMGIFFIAAGVMTVLFMTASKTNNSKNR